MNKNIITKRVIKIFNNKQAEKIAAKLASDDYINDWVTVAELPTDIEISRTLKVLDILNNNKKLGTSYGEYRINNRGLQIIARELR